MEQMTVDGQLMRADVLVREAGAVRRSSAIDRLRVGLTMLVIAHHAGQAYGPTGGRWPILQDERASLLGPFFAVNAAFFMGLFFLLAGMCTPQAYDRRGAAGFLAGRALRLGAPLLVVSLGLFAPIAYAASATSEPFWRWLIAEHVGRDGLEFGHMWFVAHLLVYAALYAAWRIVGGARAEARLLTLLPPGHEAIFGFTLLLAGVTAIVRIWYPIDVWVRLGGVLPIEVAHLPQYASLYVIGVVAGRAGWLERMPRATGTVWLIVGVVASWLRYAYSLGLREIVPLELVAPGGRGLGGITWSVWEALIAVGLCVGLPVLARGLPDRMSPLERTASGNAYGAYIVHLFVVVGLQLALADVGISPLAKFALVTLGSIPLSFLLAAALRRVPGVGRVV